MPITRKPGQQFNIGDDIIVTIVSVDGKRVMIKVEAPEGVVVKRAELPDEAVLDKGGSVTSQ